MMRFGSILLILFLVGCNMGPIRSRQAFQQHFAHRSGSDRVEVFETSGYYAPSGELRYRLFGGWYDEEADLWRLQWADYGQTRQHHWTVLEYPTRPEESAPTRREAHDRAREMRAEFECELLANY